MADVQPVEGALVPLAGHPLTLAGTMSADRHPAAVYLARLSPASCRTMRAALHAMAAILSGDQLDAQSLDWSAVRYQHTAALRSHLAEKYAPATANKMLAALRGVLQEAWQLGYLEAQAHHRAAVHPHSQKRPSPVAGHDVLYILQKRARQDGVRAFSPHDLRRTFISDLLDIGADIFTVQSLAGHANVQATARYDQRSEATRRRAAKMLHVPYSPQNDE